MSESYEGIVFRAPDDSAATAIFNAHPAPFPRRLVRLADGTYGVYRVATRTAPFDSIAVKSLAAKLSKSSKIDLAVFYDNRCGLRAATIFDRGTLSREFGEADEWWVPLAENGEPLRSQPPVSTANLDAGTEYDCVQDAIEAGLSASSMSPNVTRDTLKNAFCYDRLPVLAELG